MRLFLVFVVPTFAFIYYLVYSFVKEDSNNKGKAQWAGIIAATIVVAVSMWAISGMTNTYQHCSSEDLTMQGLVCND